MSTLTIHTQAQAQQSALLAFARRKKFAFEPMPTAARGYNQDAKLRAEVAEMRVRLFGKNIDSLLIDTEGFKFDRDEANER